MPAPGPPDHPPPLRRSDLADDPIEQFQRWYDRWRSEPRVNAEAVVFSTADGEGRPSSRYLLLRGVDQRGFVAFTNRNSRKSREVAANPSGALCFGWLDQHRQVRVGGRVERVDDAESDAYWMTRPPGSQIAGAVSDQSEPVADRTTLEARFAVLEAQVMAGDGPVPRPSHWGGIRVVPMEMEFWQSQPNRLHDRFAYRRTTPADPWTMTRLMP